MKYGRLRRECPDLAGNGANVVAVLKGKGKGKGKGKYGKSNYKWFGKSNSKHGAYRSRGKVIGKGTIYYHGQDEAYWSAWGTDTDYWSEAEYHQEWGGYFLGNAAMMLEYEVGKEETIRKEEDVHERNIVQAKGARDTLLSTWVRDPTKLCNKFSALSTDDGDDEDDNGTSDYEHLERRLAHGERKRTNMNKRQRQRRNEQIQQNSNDNSNEHDDDNSDNHSPQINHNHDHTNNEHNHNHHAHDHSINRC